MIFIAFHKYEIKKNAKERKEGRETEEAHEDERRKEITKCVLWYLFILSDGKMETGAETGI